MIYLLTIIPWTASTTDSMFGYVGQIIGDLSPLMIGIIAVGLGLIIFEVIVGVIRGRHSN